MLDGGNVPGIGTARSVPGIGTAGIEAVRSPIETSRGLPRQAYFDAELFELELSKIFMGGWFAIGFDSALKRAGDVTALTIGDLPLAMVKGDDNEIRVFHNTSIYDASPIVGSAANVKELVGTNFGWRYSLDGRLLAAPYWDGTPDPPVDALRSKGADLVEVRSASWGGVRFVNIMGSGRPFEEFVDELEVGFADVELSALSLYQSAEEQGINTTTVAANWKGVWEEQAPTPHRERFAHLLANDFGISREAVPGPDSWSWILGSKTLGMCVASSSDELMGLTLAPLGRKSTGADVDETVIISYYPNLVVLVTRCFAQVQILLPLAPEQTSRTVATLFPGKPNISSAAVAEREALTSGSLCSAIFCDETAERIQRGRHSPAYRSTLLAPVWDRAIHRFHNLVLDDLLS